MEFSIVTVKDFFDYTPAQKKAMSFLYNLPDGKLYNTTALTGKLHLSESFLRCRCYIGFDAYRVRYKGKMLWGNSKTIEEFKKEYGL